MSAEVGPDLDASRGPGDDGAAPAGRGGRRKLSGTSVLLVLGKAFQMGFGFLFWIVAARTTDVATVGVVAASVSAVMLVTQIGLLGVGSTMIVALGQGQSPGRVLDTGFTVVTLTSGLVATGYLVVSGLAGGAVGEAQTTPEYAGIFLLAGVVGTAPICFDQAGIALGRPGGTVWRYLLGGSVTLVSLAAFSVTVDAARVDATVVFGTWTLGSAVICGTGLVQLRRWIGYGYRGRVHAAALRTHLSVGVPNYLLTMTERVPALLVPVLVAHLVSPEAAAYWYPAWMLAWVAYTVPIQVGLVQFSEGVRRPDQLGRTVRSGLAWGLLLGGGAAALVGVAAYPLLLLIGADYADASATALRVLALGIVPFTVWQTYNARCRAVGLVGEGVLAGVALACLICVTTVAVAPHGSTALALAWVSSSSVGALWAAHRLVRTRAVR